MIIEMLLDLIYNIFNLMLVFEIPRLPDGVTGFVEQAFDYIVSAVGIVANYTHMEYLLTLFAVIIAIDVAIAIYHFIMWILKKIPMLGIE